MVVAEEGGNMPICLAPLSLPRPNGRGSADRIIAPCGKCVNCLERRRDEWTFRLSQEMKTSDMGHFITLTYADETMSYNDKGEGTVNNSDLTRFLKRLRTYFTRGYIPPSDDPQSVLEPLKSALKLRPLKMPIKYYAVSEYGSKYGRPHFHLILFNLPYYGNQYDMNKLKQILTYTWQMGIVDIGKVEPGSIHYVTGYVHTITDYDPESQERPRAWMSKGLGKSYLNSKAKVDWHQETQTPHYIAPDGIRQPLPRYLKKKIFRPETLEAINQSTQIFIEAGLREEWAIAEKHNSNPGLAISQAKIQEQVIKTKRLTKSKKL